LQSGDRFEELQRVLRTHAAVIHAILVNGLESGIEEPLSNITDPFDHGIGEPGFGFLGLEAHDPDIACSQSFHPGNGATDLGESEVERIRDPFRPVHDGGTEAIHLDPGGVALFDRRFEGRVGDLVEIALGEACDLDVAGFDGRPAEPPGGRQLRFEGIAGFVADTAECHGKMEPG
jgi:hypothetical protein